MTRANVIGFLVSKNIFLFWRPARCKCEASLHQVEGLDGYRYILSPLPPALVLNAGRNGRAPERSIATAFPRESGLAFQQVTEKEARLYSIGLPWACVP